MKNSKIILKDPQNNKISQQCQNCRIIRIFLLSVLFIILLGLIKSDQLHYLQLVTPMNVAILIICSGVIMFFFKLVKLIKEKKQI